MAVRTGKANADDRKRADKRTKVEMPDGRTIIVAAGDPIPPEGKVVGKAEEVPTPQESAEARADKVRTAEVKQPSGRRTAKRAPKKKA